VFRGASNLVIDTKGRLAMPARYQAKLSELSDGNLVITVEPTQKCLVIYPLNEWEIVEERLINLPALDEQASRLQRVLIGSAADVELDKTRRILIPNHLRKYAELDKNVVLVGLRHRFQLWNEAAWDKTYADDLLSVNQPDTWPNEVRDLRL